jgi:hypothetical protein
MVFGAEGTAGDGAGADWVGVDAALAALEGAALTTEEGGVFETGLAAGFTVDLAIGLSIGLTTGFITDLAGLFFWVTSLVVDFLADTVALTAVFSAGLTVT